MKIPMRDLPGADGNILAGAINGRKALARLLDLTGPEPDQPEKVFLDFEGINVATASFLREAVLGFRDAVRRRRSNFYPVIANANDLVTEELRVLLTSQGGVLTVCSLAESGQPYNPRLVGKLDPKQRLTLDLVKERGIADAAELKREYGSNEKPIAQTAWNNRLTSLAALGLLVEFKEGRAKRYRPLFAES